jgi:hypothetical protein
MEARNSIFPELEVEWWNDPLKPHVNYVPGARSKKSAASSKSTPKATSKAAPKAESKPKAEAKTQPAGEKKTAAKAPAKKAVAKK